MEDKNGKVSISGKLISAILLFCISLLFFSIISHEVVIEKEDWFDKSVFDYLHTYSSPLTLNLFNFLTFFGSSAFIFPAYLILVLLLIYKNRKSDAIDVGILGITSTILLYILKISFARARPDFPLINQSTTYSFPSGHTLSAFIFFSILVIEVWKFKIQKKWQITLTILFAFLSLAVALSRIILRYHFASDVLAGLSLGIAYVLLFFWLRKKWRKIN
jgi:membrane-associated phospholipid phosphatase